MVEIIKIMVQFIRSISYVRLFATPWITARQASLSSTNSRSSRPLSQWCHPTISSSVVPFFSCVQSFPASWSFPMSHINIQMHSSFFLIGWNYSSGCKVLLGNTWLNLSCCCLHWLGPPVCCIAKSSLSYCQWHRLFTQLFYKPEPCQFYSVSTTGIPSFSLPLLWLSTA